MRVQAQACFPYLIIVCVVMTIYSACLLHLSKSFQRPPTSPTNSPLGVGSGADGGRWMDAHGQAGRKHTPSWSCTPESREELAAGRNVVIRLSSPYRYFDSNHWFHISEYYVSRHNHVAPKLPRNGTVYIIAPHHLFVAKLIPMTFFFLLLAFTDGTARTAAVLPTEALLGEGVVPLAGRAGGDGGGGTGWFEGAEGEEDGSGGRANVWALDTTGVEYWLYNSSLPAFRRARRYAPDDPGPSGLHRGLSTFPRLDDGTQDDVVSRAEEEAREDFLAGAGPAEDTLQPPEPRSIADAGVAVRTRELRGSFDGDRDETGDRVKGNERGEVGSLPGWPHGDREHEREPWPPIGYAEDWNRFDDLNRPSASETLRNRGGGGHTRTSVASSQVHGNEGGSLSGPPVSPAFVARGTDAALRQSRILGRDSATADLGVGVAPQTGNASGHSRDKPSRSCSCARYIGEFGPAPVERGYWFKEGAVESARERIDALCGNIYRLREQGRRADTGAREDERDEEDEEGYGEASTAPRQGGASRRRQRRRRLVIYQRDADRQLLGLDRIVRELQKQLGQGWRVVPIVHDNDHEPCWLYSQLMDADMLLTPHGFQSMLLLFLPPGATIIEVFPYKYWKEGYAPLAKEWGVQHEYIMSRPVSWFKGLSLFFVPSDRCMRSIDCRKWSRKADVRLEDNHLEKIAKAARRASRHKEGFLPPSPPVAPDYPSSDR